MAIGDLVVKLDLTGPAKRGLEQLKEAQAHRVTISHLSEEAAGLTQMAWLLFRELHPELTAADNAKSRLYTLNHKTGEIRDAGPALVSWEE